MTKFKFQGFLKENGLKLSLTSVQMAVAVHGGSVAGQGSRGRPGSAKKFKLLSTFQPKFEK